MNEKLNELSEFELAHLIDTAQKTLRERQIGKRKEVAAQIKELAASIGYAVELTEISSEKTAGSSRKGSKVAGTILRDHHRRVLRTQNINGQGVACNQNGCVS